MTSKVFHPMSHDFRMFYEHHKSVGNYAIYEAVEQWVRMTPDTRSRIEAHHTRPGGKVNGQGQ